MKSIIPLLFLCILAISCDEDKDIPTLQATFHVVKTDNQGFESMRELSENDRIQTQNGYEYSIRVSYPTQYTTYITCSTLLDPGWFSCDEILSLDSGGSHTWPINTSQAVSIYVSVDHGVGPENREDRTAIFE